MLEYDVEYKCGCHGTITLTLPKDKALKRVKWYKSHVLCPACKAKLNASLDVEEQLPELEGSPKQIAWASDIRRKALYTIEELKAYSLHLCVPETKERTALVYDVIAREHKAQTSCRFWIDNREQLTKRHFLDAFSELFDSETV